MHCVTRMFFRSRGAIFVVFALWKVKRLEDTYVCVCDICVQDVLNCQCVDGVTSVGNKWVWAGCPMAACPTVETTVESARALIGYSKSFSSEK